MSKEVCAKCLDRLPRDGDYINCRAGCKKNYHIQCSTLSEQTFRRMSEPKRDAWMCLVCREEKKKDKQVSVSRKDTGKTGEDKRKTNITAAGNGDEEDEEEEEVQVQNKLDSEEKHCEDKNVNVSNQLLNDMNNKLAQALKDIAELTKSVNFMNAKYDDLLVEVKELRVVKSKFEGVVSKVAELQDRVNEIEQYSRNRNIEIKGIEERPNENLKNVICKVANKMGVETITENDIDIVHRVSNRNNREPRDIVVQFKDTDRKETLMSQRKERVKSNEVTNGRLDNVIYINEHLTPYNKMILWETKKRCREVKYKYVWPKNGKIYVRKDDKDRAYRIRNEEDIKKIV